MFEAGLITSRNEIKTKTRLTLVISILVEGGLLAVMIVLPLLHPAVLQFVTAHTPIVPVLSLPRVVQPVQTSSNTANSNPAVPQMTELVSSTRPIIDGHFEPLNEAEPTTEIGTMGGPGNLTGIQIGDSGIGKAVVQGASVRGPMRVSGGVMAGRLIVPIAPEYPRIALATRSEGTVVVEATISATGMIENAHVISGPPLLWNAALDAVKKARYEPYKLGNDPVSVETTINIVFHLDN